jgi:hypothetical protein
VSLPVLRSDSVRQAHNTHAPAVRHNTESDKSHLEGPQERRHAPMALPSPAITRYDQFSGSTPNRRTRPL